MSAIQINNDARARLEELDIYTLHNGFWDVNPQSVFEPPILLPTLSGGGWPVTIGAFSYMMSPLGKIGKIGRYCSIASMVNADPGEHPVDWLGSSLFFFDDKWEMWGKYPKKHTGSRPRFTPAPFENFKPVEVGNDVWIGEGAFIRGGVKIGDGAIIAGRAVVTKDVEPYMIMGGVPARVIRPRFPERTIERLMRLRWWQYEYIDFAGVSFTEIDKAVDQIEALVDEGLRPYTRQTLTGRDVLIIAT